AKHHQGEQQGEKLVQRVSPRNLQVEPQAVEEIWNRQHQVAQARPKRRKRRTGTIRDTDAEQSLTEGLAATEATVQQAEIEQSDDEADEPSRFAEARSPADHGEAQERRRHGEDESVDDKGRQPSPEARD